MSNGLPGGVMHGLKDSPIQSVKFKNCNITAQRGLVLGNVKDPDLSGLKLTVAEGESQSFKVTLRRNRRRSRKAVGN